MPKPKISPSKPDRDGGRARNRQDDGPRDEVPQDEARPTLAEVLSDISQLADEEDGARDGSALVKLDRVIRAAVAEHTEGKNPGAENAGAENAGIQMDVNQAERAVEVTTEEDERCTNAPVLPLPSNVMPLPSADRREKLRIVEALLFAASEPLKETELVRHFGQDEDVRALLEELQGLYAGRGVNLVRVAGKWTFRTAEDLSFLLERQAVTQRRLSRAALETLAIIAYHQPVTRAEIEEIRGVSTSKGTIDVLLETNWIKLRGRRRAPGRPVTYGTTEAFLEHFGFEQIQDLPGLGELKGAGLLDSNLPPGFAMPNPDDAPDLQEDEDPLEDEEPLGAGDDDRMQDPEASPDKGA